MGRVHGCSRPHPHPETGYRSHAETVEIKSTCVLHDYCYEHTFDFQNHPYFNAYLPQIRESSNLFLSHRYGFVLWPHMTSAPSLPFHRYFHQDCSDLYRE